MVLRGSLCFVPFLVFCVLFPRRNPKSEPAVCTFKIKQQLKQHSQNGDQQADGPTAVGRPTFQPNRSAELKQARTLNVLLRKK
jgi:hypothetical protein